MSEKTHSEIIAEYERSKTQEKKIDSLNDNIVKLSETLGKFLEMIPGSKKEGEESKESKNSVPTKIEEKKEKKEEKKEEKSLFSQFLGL